MKLVLITVFDQKAEAFLRPVATNTVGTAVRDFQALVNNPEHDFGKFPHDYTLFQLGEWSDRDASFDLLPAPKTLGNGLELLNPEIGDN